MAPCSIRNYGCGSAPETLQNCIKDGGLLAVSAHFVALIERKRLDFRGLCFLVGTWHVSVNLFICIGLSEYGGKKNVGFPGGG